MLVAFNIGLLAITVPSTLRLLKNQVIVTAHANSRLTRWSQWVDATLVRCEFTQYLLEAAERPFVLYSLRHTFVTRLGESGCDAWTLARIAGHSNISRSSRYVHPSENAVLDAMARLGGHKSRHNQNQALELNVANDDTGDVN